MRSGKSIFVTFCKMLLKSTKKGGVIRSGLNTRARTEGYKSCRALILKGKAVPLEAWSGPEGSRKLRFPDYMTTSQDGGKIFSLRHRPPLPPGNAPGTHFC